MRPKELSTKLTTTIKAGLPIMIKGAPGIGKTDIVTQATAACKFELIVAHPVVSDPTDFKGQPWVIDGKADFLPYGDLRRLVEAKKPTVYFLDDLGQAPAVVQAACMQLILARRINGHRVSDKVVFIAATNRREDRAGVTGILEPVKSRFAAIWELTPNVDDWIEWALQNDMPTELIGFVHFRPSVVSSGVATNDIVNHPCPRTLANAGRLIKVGLSDLEDLAGAVGEACAIELVGYIRIANSLPNIDSILLNPDKAAVPTEPAALYAVTSALVGKVTAGNVDKVFQYGTRLPSDFGVLLVRDIIRKNAAIQNTKAFITWTLKNKGILFN